MTASFTFDAEVWLYRGPDPCHFVSLPAEVSDVIQERTLSRPNALGAPLVGVATGQTRWQTSLLPDSGQKGSRTNTWPQVSSTTIPGHGSTV